jgi:hypothetical protein
MQVEMWWMRILMRKRRKLGEMEERESTDGKDESRRSL